MLDLFYDYPLYLASIRIYVISTKHHLQMAQIYLAHPILLLNGTKFLFEATQNEPFGSKSFLYPNSYSINTSQKQKKSLQIL